MIRPAVAACSRGAGVTAGVTRPGGGKDRGQLPPGLRGFLPTMMMASRLDPPARHVGGLLADAALRARCHNHYTWRVSGAAISAEYRACGRVSEASESPAVPVWPRPAGGQNVRPPRYLRTDIEDNWTSERI